MAGYLARGFRRLIRLGRDERAAIEYAMIACGISIAVAATVSGIGNTLKVNFYGKVNTALAPN